MKKAFKILSLLLCVSIFISCSVKTKSLIIIEKNSNIYSKEDINYAIYVIKDMFKDRKDCKLLELEYIGDENLYDFNNYDVDELIIFNSSFYVEKSAVLIPNKIYKGYKFILGRKKGEIWKVVNHGYGFKNSFVRKSKPPA